MPLSRSGPAAGVAAVPASGNPAIDGLLSGVRWTGPVSYSDPDSFRDYDQASDFAGQLSPVQLAAVHAALRGTGAGAGFSVAGLTGLDPVYAGPGSDQGTLRLANMAPYQTAYAWYPDTAPEGGDAFFGASGQTPKTGNYDGFTILHELGHTLGLKHGHEADSYGALPADRDTMEYTLMSYRAHVGADPAAGYPNETWGYAQTFMIQDIAALQHMYGADYGTNAGNTTYRWSPTSGATVIDGQTALSPGGNRIFLTIWDGGGIDTYDLGAYRTGVTIDLRPGGHSIFSKAQLADLDAFSDQTPVARGNVFNAWLFRDNPASLIENAIGGAGDDRITGNAAANRLEGGAGKDWLAGLAGQDTGVGGAGNDFLAGGAGGDRFVFSGRFGHDRIVDFSPDTPGEVIDLGALAAVADWDDLLADHLAEVNGTAVITVGSSTITLVGVALPSLASDDFLI